MNRRLQVTYPKPIYNHTQKHTALRTEPLHSSHAAVRMGGKIWMVVCTNQYHQPQNPLSAGWRKKRYLQQHSRSQPSISPSLHVAAQDSLGLARERVRGVGILKWAGIDSVRVDQKLWRKHTNFLPQNRRAGRGLVLGET
ncbi:hypothetical protein BaRGS_00025948 [Batillaria attramentaria]|uniref:Uncharacterized protein n=1 Tax=Batillaria attramentaria TaxID=370345 RepID=A0ABD0K5R1_9CAEN